MFNLMLHPLIPVPRNIAWTQMLMADAPPNSPTSTVWQTALADSVHIMPEKIVEQSFQKHPLLAYMFNGSIAARNGMEGEPKVKGVKRPTQIMIGSADRLALEVKTGNMATTGMITPAAAVTQTTDVALPTMPFRTLSGEWAVGYGVVSWGLEQEILRGGEGAIHKFLPEAQKDICQQISALLSTSLYADGTSQTWDGLGMWDAVTGTKWGSQNIATTDTFLIAQRATANATAFTYDTWMTWVTRAYQGPLAGTGVLSEGNRPTVCVTTSAMIRLFRKWIQDKVVYNVNPTPANLAFLEYGQPDDYVIIDGVLCFADDTGLSTLLSTNFAVGYMFNPDDLRIIFHKSKKYGFTGIDAGKNSGGNAPEPMTAIELPTYVHKQIFKKVVLGNMCHIRPRNLLRFVIANA